MMQAEDISDEAFRAAVRACTRVSGCSMSWEVAECLSAPFKVVLAKARRLRSVANSANGLAHAAVEATGK